MKKALYFSSIILLSGYGYTQEPIKLTVLESEITVDGKKASIYKITQPDGTEGLYAKKGDVFNVELENKLQVPTSVHWHGLILPNKDDGVAFITQLPVYPNTTWHYEFPLVQAGTFWMHSHYGLQEQRLLSAPLILYGQDDKELADQEVVILLSDFSFTPATEIFRKLTCGSKMAMTRELSSPDIIDVNYDAFLTNSRTLDDPEVISVEAGKKIRLRFIDGASSTNFFLSLGHLKGDAIAVDGNRIEPLSGSEFELAVAQRIDVVVRIPEEGGSFPVIAQGEGTDMQTGVILTTKGAPIHQLSIKAAKTAGRLTNALESKYVPLSPLEAKPIDRKLALELGGDMMKYEWTLNGKSWPEVTPLVVKKGERVEITFNNVTTMSHPMHLHGHVFQVTAIDGKALNGPMRDTVLVPPKSSVAIQFDAANPGAWPLHCHLLYHLEGGMLTVLRYQD